MSGRIVLVVHHSPSPVLQGISSTVLDATRSAAHAVAEETGDPIDVRERQALEPDVDELLQADAVILGTPANFGYISGALKHYFDSTFLSVQSEKKGLPFSWWIRGGKDTTGAEKAMRSITTGLGWDLAAEPVAFVGDPEPYENALEEMAQTVVASLVR